MLLSEKYKLGFVHIPKTAGTSLRTSLEHIHDHFSDRLVAKVLRKIPGLDDKWPFIAIKHYMHMSIARLFTYSDEITFDDYSFIAVSRHPEKWLISYYQHIIRHHRSGIYAEYFPDRYLNSFDDFARWYLNENHAPLQSAMLCNEDGVIRADHVAKQERLEEHINELLDEFGVPHVGIPRRNSAPSGEQITLSDQTRELIKDYFESDFKLFGYDTKDELDITRARGVFIPQNQLFFSRVAASSFDPWKTYSKLDVI